MTNRFRSFSHAAVAAAILATVTVTLTGCPRKKATEAPDAGVAETPVVDAAVPTASNEADVTRFPDEAKLDRVAATTIATVTNVRKAPPSGAVITTIPKGTVVLEIAQKDKFFLVTFDDPKDATKKLMGWIFQDAFSATPATPVKPPGVNPCPAGQQLLIAEQDFCGKVCKVAADCPNGQACTGSAKLFGLNGKVGDPVSVCSFLAGIGDAGAPAATDAGAKVDAGAAKPDAGAAADAGGASQTVAGVQEPPDASGKCPANFVLVASDKLCHRTCNQPNGVECIAKSRCTGTLAKDRVCVAK